MGRTLSGKEFKVFEKLVSLNQKSMQKFLFRFLSKYYPSDKIKYCKEYVVAEGDIPVILCAHMDTVFPDPATEVFYDRRKNVCWSPQGLGADDRAGIYAIICIIMDGFRPHIIFSTDEERGCVGAANLVVDYPTVPFKGTKYIIQLDRRGTNDCVFYECDNKDFIKYIENFGFQEAFGTFTDITEYAPTWGIAATNLSIGYRDEHTVKEILQVGAMFDTISKVENILSQEEHPFFEYIEAPTHFKFNYGSSFAWDFDRTCDKCHKKTTSSNSVLFMDKGYKRHCYCYNCLDADELSWCDICYEPYMKADADPECEKFGYSICPKCIRGDYYPEQEYSSKVIALPLKDEYEEEFDLWD